jgi:hypothetical protein
MQNLRQRFGKVIVAGLVAVVLSSGATTYAYIGGPNKNTCAFVLGQLLRVPSDSGAAAVFNALMISFNCD